MSDNYIIVVLECVLYTYHYIYVHIYYTAPSICDLIRIEN